MYSVVTFISFIVVSSRNYIVYAPKYTIKAKAFDDVIMKMNYPLHRVAENKQIKDLSLRTASRKENTRSTRRLAYKDDLIEALNELQKRQYAKKGLAQNKTYPETTTNLNFLPAVIVTTKPNRILKSPNNVKDIIELIQSGINVNRQQPTNENFEWMKIRIPRNKL
ncbi:hypothetical protein evm_005540 [Chilo suppressalis]|nr:hypothetical protein evm_005540 [Chilo suppressalis]